MRPFCCAISLLLLVPPIAALNAGGQETDHAVRLSRMWVNTWSGMDISHRGEELQVEENGVWIPGYWAEEVALTRNLTITQAWKPCVMNPFPSSPLPPKRWFDPRLNEHVLTFMQSGVGNGYIYLEDKLAVWLRQDALWGGHAAANELRYLAGDGGGLFPTVTDLVPNGNGALGVLNCVEQGPVGKPIAAQLLVRLDLRPTGMLTALRPLSGEHGSYFGPARRLFRVETNYYLYTNTADSSPGTLQRISRRGDVQGTVATFPPRHIAYGLVDGRWLVLGDLRPGSRQTMWLYDMTGGRLKPLPGAWAEPYPASYVVVPAAGSHILVTSVAAKTTYLVRIPDGQRVALPNPDATRWQYLWHGMAIIAHGKQFSIYGAKNGRLLTTLKDDR